MNVKKNTHYYGLDVLRLIWLYAIVHYHTYETFFFNDNYILRYEDSIYTRLEYLIRALSFSGFSIVTLSSFLLGWSHMNFKKWLSLIGIMCIGTYLLAAVEGDGFLAPYWEWDIYPFLAVSFTILLLLKSFPKLMYITSLLSIGVLFFPFWYWESHFPVGAWRDIFVGDCTVIKNGSWPLLPWIALPLIMFSLAHWIQSHNSAKKYVHNGSKQEFLLWTFLLLALLPWVADYFYTPIGPGFACYMHRRGPISFLSYWLWVLLLIRLSLLTTVNDYLNKFRFIHFLTSLQWSRNMGLAYALHFIFLDIGYNWSNIYLSHHYLLDVFFILMVIGVELLCRLLQKVRPPFW